MTIEQTIADEIARIHVEINDASDAYRQRLHDAVRSWANVHRQNQELQALVNRQRAEIERLTGALRIEAEQADDLLQECNDLRAANHNYARLLTDVRAALDAEEDADLPEAARALVAENEDRRTALVQCSEERRAEWTRAERAEAEIAEATKSALALSQGQQNTLAKLTLIEQAAIHVRERLDRAESQRDRILAAVRAYKAAVDAQSGVADAQAALFAVLEEVEHADCK